MKLLLSQDVVAQLRLALESAGRREVGGIMMGEHVGVDTFMVSEITTQLTGGTFATFVRLIEGIVGPLRSFFRITNHDYVRFNYIGEWHSHHSFALEPSSRDNDTMLSLLAEPDMGARFAALLLVKLNNLHGIDCSATFYRPAALPMMGAVELVAGEVRGSSQLAH